MVVFYIQHRLLPQVLLFSICPACPRIVCGRLWTKIFCPRKSGSHENLQVREGKNAPNLTIRSILQLNIEEITSSGIPQQQQPRKRSYRPWGCYLRQKPTGSKLPWRDLTLKSNHFYRKSVVSKIPG